MVFRILATALSTLLLMGPAPLEASQASAQGNPSPAQAASPAPTDSAPSDKAPSDKAPSAMVQTSLSTLGQAVGQLHIEKWKMSKDVRQATIANVASIRKDLDATLPGLLTTADASPSTISALLPVSRNLGALYDVVLRVTVIAESAAPQDQTGALEQAMTELEGARRDLSDRLQSTAASQEQRMQSLQKSLAERPAPTAVAPPVPTPAAPAPVIRPKRKKKLAAPPAASPAPAPSK